MPKTIKKKVTLNRLDDVDVRFVSLVGRGANQIPFRVVKGDEQSEGKMDFISKILKGAGAKSNAFVSAIAIKCAEGTDVERVESVLREKGFKTDDKVQGQASGEDHVVYKQAESAGDDCVFEIAPSVFVSVCGVKKSFDPFMEADSFMANMKSGAFFPNLNVALEVLQRTIGNIMFRSEGGRPVDKVEKVLAEFNSFVMAMLREIPEDAFKLHDLDLTSADLTQVEDVEKSATTITEDEMKIEEVKKEMSEMLTSQQEQVLNKVQSLVEGVSKQVAEVNDSLNVTVKAVKEDVESLSKSQKELSEKVDATVKDFASFKERMEGTVLGEGDSPDPEDKPDDDSTDDVAKGDSMWDGCGLDVLEIHGTR